MELLSSELSAVLPTGQPHSEDGSSVLTKIPSSGLPNAELNPDVGTRPEVLSNGSAAGGAHFPTVPVPASASWGDVSLGEPLTREVQEEAQKAKTAFQNR